MSTFKPMLACSIEPEDVDRELMVSIKLEGVRGTVHPHGLFTRQQKPFGNSLLTTLMAPVVEYCNKLGITIEGEFYLHGWPFKRISSATRGNGNNDALQLEFHVFDCYLHSVPDSRFELRHKNYNWVCEQLNKRGVSWVKPVEQTIMSSPEIIRQTFLNAVAQGYEGWVGRDPNAPYKQGRSTAKEAGFVRGKPELTYDGIVLQIIERQENLLESEINETGYKFKRQDKDAKRGTGLAQNALVLCNDLPKPIVVQLTKGLKDEEATEHGESRRSIWTNRQEYLCRPIKFVAIPVAGDDLPRSPRFLDWRDDLEPSLMYHAESDCYWFTFDRVEDLTDMDAAISHPVEKQEFIDGWFETN